MYNNKDQICYRFCSNLNKVECKFSMSFRYNQIGKSSNLNKVECKSSPSYFA